MKARLLLYVPFGLLCFYGARIASSLVPIAWLASALGMAVGAAVVAVVIGRVRQTRRAAANGQVP